MESEVIDIRVRNLERSVGKIEQAMESIDESLKTLARLEVHHAETRDGLTRAFEEMKTIKTEQSTVNKDVEERMREIEGQMPTLKLIRNWVIGGVGALLALVCLALTSLVLIVPKASAGMLEETRFCGPPARDARGQIIRRADVLRAFEQAHPCPAPVGTTCPGWNRDHVIPLACGGCDSVENLQWLPTEAWRAKSLFERKIYGGHGISPGCP